MILSSFVIFEGQPEVCPNWLILDGLGARIGRGEQAAGEPEGEVSRPTGTDASAVIRGPDGRVGGPAARGNF